MNSAAEWFADAEQRERVEKKRMSNADRIRQMTDEELCDFLGTITDCCHGAILSNCDRCPMKYADKAPVCRIDSWLKQEAKDDVQSD